MSQESESTRPEVWQISILHDVDNRSTLLVTVTKVGPYSFCHWISIVFLPDYCDNYRELGRNMSRFVKISVEKFIDLTGLSNHIRLGLFSGFRFSKTVLRLQGFTIVAL